MNNKCAVLVTSCDAYQDIWDPFFKLMDTYWKDIPFNVYLNTEKIQYNKKFNHFSVKSINLLDKYRSNSNVTWSQRMLDVLKRIEEEYVFVLVEDFFLRENVQTDLIETIIENMDQHPLIAQVQFFGTRWNCDLQQQNIACKRMEMEEIDDTKAKVVFVPTVWRKSALIKWLRPHESIWAFESCGAKRAKRWKYKEKVYRVYSPAIFNYLWEKDCYCVVNGKWMLHPLLLSLFKDNGIDVDFLERGTITVDEWKAVTIKTIIKRNGVLGTLKKFISRLRSIF